MLHKNRTVAVLGVALTVAAILLALTVTAAFAGQTVNGDYTLLYPADPQETCEPDGTIEVSGVPDGWNVRFKFQHEQADGTWSTLGSEVDVESTGEAVPVTIEFPYDGLTGEFRVIAFVEEPGVEQSVASLVGKWTVICEPPPPPPPPPPGDAGCTPGFWRQPHHHDSWVDYSPGDSFDTVFGVTSSFGGTLGEAVQLGGGGEYALARHAVAALLNASSPDVEYAFTEQQVKEKVVLAYMSEDFEGAKDQFEEANEAFCPLD